MKIKWDDVQVNILYKSHKSKIYSTAMKYQDKKLETNVIKESLGIHF